MSRYIDANELKKTLIEQRDYRAPNLSKIANEAMTSAFRIALREVDNASTADVRPVVRGKWIKTPRTHLILTGKMAIDEHGNIYAERKHETIFRLKCSCCGLTEEIETDFCPNCGAEMRGKQNK